MRCDEAVAASARGGTAHPGPDRGSFQGGDAALGQRRQACVELRVEKAPSRVSAPFEMPTIGPPIIVRRVIPCDAERLIVPSQRSEQGKFQHIANVACVLIAHLSALRQHR